MKKKKVWDYLWDMLFILPAFVLFFAVIWYPLIKSILYSFTNYDGMSKSFDFVGLTNYMKIFSSKYIKAGIGNTLKFAVVNCLLCNIFQLLLALVLDKKLILKRYLRVAFYVPVLLCTVVVSVVFGHIMQYNGILNTFFIFIIVFVLIYFTNELKVAGIGVSKHISSPLTGCIKYNLRACNITRPAGSVSAPYLLSPAIE